MSAHYWTWNQVSWLTYIARLIIIRTLDIDDVNKAFAEMHEEVESKVYKKDYDVVMNQQNNMNEVICAENCSARWLWRSGQLSPNGYAVPWEAQSVNTCPENFLWEEDKT